MLQISLKEHLEGLRDSKLAELIYAFSQLSIDIRQELPEKLKGETLNRNKYGEIKKELDEWTNKFLIEQLGSTGLVNKIYSEELEEAVALDYQAPFFVSIDPLDGSSNIESNNPFGTILGVYKNDLPTIGTKIVGAAYILYGPITTLVYRTEDATHEFVKQRKGKSEYFLVNEGLRLPEPGKVFGIGGDPLEWDKRFLKFAKNLFRRHKLKVRYCGAFVGDFSQILHHGGFFAYPASLKNPSGKLRLFFEVQPMSYLIEGAGGAASNGRERILEIESMSVDATVPVFMGNRYLVSELEEVLNEPEQV
ncbi:MAG: class 1 fructose-bisphosphatase [Candidatus Anstonellales archaeon]